MRFRRFLRGNLFLLLILLVIPFRFHDVAEPLVNITNFRQAQTATIALNFYKNGINLLQTELDIFGIGKERFLTLEFPLYEAIVAILYKIFFVSDMWGRLVSITAGFIGALYLYKLVILITNNVKLAFFSLFFFLFAPLNMFYQQDFLMEATIICILLAGSYHYCKWVDGQNKKDLFLAIVLISMGFMQKAMYGPFWLLPLSWYYMKKFSLQSIFSIKFILPILIPLITLFLWQQHVNYINTINEHAYFTTYNIGQLRWNFGTFADRFSFSMWAFRFENILNGIFLKPGLLIFLIGLFATKRIVNNRFFYIWLFAELIYFLSFFPIQSHIYYQMVMIPAISFFTAAGLIKMSDWMHLAYTKSAGPKSLKRYIKPLFLALFCAFFIWKTWLNSRWNSYIDWQWYNRLQAVGRSVPLNSYGIFVNPGYDWNSVYTYYPKLKMLLVGAENVSSKNIHYWQNLGYSYLILHEYDKYPDYFRETKVENSLDFLKEYKEVLTLEDFKVYLLMK